MSWRDIKKVAGLNGMQEAQNREKWQNLKEAYTAKVKNGYKEEERNGFMSMVRLVKMNMLH